MTYDGMLSALQDALNSLEMAPFPPGGIPYTECIPGIARELILISRPPRDRMPQAEVRSRLSQMASALRQLEAAADFSEPSLPVSFAFRIKMLQMRSEAALQAKEIEDAVKALPPGARGQPKKEMPRRVVERLALEYERLTGVPAKRPNDWNQKEATGAFYELVVKVFDILGIDASPDAMTKSVLATERNTAKAS